MFPAPLSRQKPPVILVHKPVASSKTTETHSGAASTLAPLGGYSWTTLRGALNVNTNSILHGTLKVRTCCPAHLRVKSMLHGALEVTSAVRLIRVGRYLVVHKDTYDARTMACHKSQLKVTRCDHELQGQRCMHAFTCTHACMHVCVRHKDIVRCKGHVS